MGACSQLFCSSGLAQGKAAMAALDKSEGRDARKQPPHPRLDQLFQMQLTADQSAKYTKYLHLFNAY